MFYFKPKSLCQIYVLSKFQESGDTVQERFVDVPFRESWQGPPSKKAKAADTGGPLGCRCCCCCCSCWFIQKSVAIGARPSKRPELPESEGLVSGCCCCWFVFHSLHQKFFVRAFRWSWQGAGPAKKAKGEKSSSP